MKPMVCLIWIALCGSAQGGDITLTWASLDEAAARRYLQASGLTELKFAKSIPEILDARRLLWGFPRNARLTEAVFAYAQDAGALRVRLLISPRQGALLPTDARLLGRKDMPAGFGFDSASVTVAVQDIDAEVAFYREALQFQVQKAATPVTGSVRLGPPGDAGFLRLIARPTPGTQRVGLTLPVRDILTARRQVLASKGAVLWGPAGMLTPYFGNHRILTARTPGGTVLELVEFSAQ